MGDTSTILGSAAAAAPESPSQATLPSVAPQDKSGQAAAAASSPALAPEYLTGIEVSAEQRPGYEAFGTALQQDGVGAKAGNVVLSWIHATRQRGGPPEPEEAKHAFTYNAAHFEPRDAPYLTSFLNAMHAAGATQAEVDAALGVYARFQTANARASAAAYREAEQMDLEDVQSARDWLRTEYGDEARANVRLLKRYVGNLPAKEREVLESERNADGVAALNDPQRLRELIELARGGGKAAPQKSAADERAEIERVMREDRGRYNRDERMQARYRDLLRGATPTNEKPTPQDRAAIDAEIAKLEAQMRANRSAWFRDEVSQARLRKLYAARDGGNLAA